MKLIIRWIIVALSLVAAALLIPGIYIDDASGWFAVIITAAILGLVNALIRPILAFLSCGCIVLTMGLFMLVINAFTLWLSSWIAVNLLGVGFYVKDFWSALFGGIVVSIVSFVLSLLLTDD
jgi:putative membrane protein